MFEFALLPSPTAAEIAREFAQPQASQQGTLYPGRSNEATRPLAQTQLTNFKPLDLKGYHQKILSPEYQAEQEKLEAQRKAQRQETITSLVDELYKAKIFLDPQLKDNLIQSLISLDNAIVQISEGERLTELPERFAKSSSALVVTQFMTPEELEKFIFKGDPILYILETLKLVVEFRDGFYEALPEGMKPGQANHQDPKVNALYQEIVRKLRPQILPKYGIELED